MDHSPPDSSVRGMSQARILECGHFLLQGIILTQGSNSCRLHLLHWQVGSLPLAPPGKPSFFSKFPKHKAMATGSFRLTSYLILQRSSKRPCSSWGSSRAMAVSAYMEMTLWPARRAVSRTTSFSSARACAQRGCQPDLLLPRHPDPRKNRTPCYPAASGREAEPPRREHVSWPPP